MVYALDEQCQYLHDVTNNLFHKRGCSKIPADAELTAHPNLVYMLRRHIPGCSQCLKKEWLQFLRERNQQSIQRTDYQYVYSVNSKVFHTRDCPQVLLTTREIQGSTRFETVKKTGRRPCKACNPVPGKWIEYATKQDNAAREKPTARQLAQANRRSLARFKEARIERTSHTDADFHSKSDRNDFYTLTQPRLGFFAGRGYKYFHLRSCSKVAGLTHIRGFATYESAAAAGFRPCKQCKPNSKHNIINSVPITNEVRPGETVDDMVKLCIEHGYECDMANYEFYFSTPVGKWRVNTRITPYILYHINLTRTPDNVDQYHRQPRMFLSLWDAFYYACRHDTKLSAELESSTEDEQEDAG